MDARECVFDTKVEVVRQVKKQLSEEDWEKVVENLKQSTIETNHGLDKWDKIWRDDLDYSGYFKNYRAQMVKAFELEAQMQKEMKETGEIKDPFVYAAGPLRAFRETQCYLDDKKI